MVDPRFDLWYESTHPKGKPSWELDDYEEEEEESTVDDGASL